MIVESPAKAKTIKKYLGAGYVVKASVGHVKDLPKKKMGIDIEHDFQPEYVVIDGKEKVLAEIKEAAKNATRVLLAPDPDREGEAIAWHIAEEMRPANPNIQRVLFNEITKKAINEAIGNPLELDAHKFESQQARRILDRLVGYQISPVLWKKVQARAVGRARAVGGGAAGRRARGGDQRLHAGGVLDRRGAASRAARRRRSRPRSRSSTASKAELTQRGPGPRGRSTHQERAARASPSVERKERRKNAPPPFITSKLQQEALQQAALLAQEDHGPGAAALRRRRARRRRPGRSHHLHAYRLDPPVGRRRRRGARLHRRAATARTSLPAEPVVFKTKKGAQDAHEAIRPTSTEVRSRDGAASCGPAARAAGATSARPTICCGSTR